MSEWRLKGVTNGNGNDHSGRVRDFPFVQILQEGDRRGGDDWVIN